MSQNALVVVDGGPLRSADIAAVATGAARVQLADAALARIAQTHDFAVRAAGQRPIYGRTTGVGANRDVPIELSDARAVGLLRSHATSAGPPRAPERVRAMLAIRLNELAAGGSGVGPDVVSGLLAMITADALPPVREFGSIGTGDLSALAVTALALMGELPTSRPLGTTVRFSIHDAPGFLSSNAAAIGDAALAQAALRRMSSAALGVAALSFTAVDGNPEAFAEVVEQVTPFRGAQDVCRTLRRLLPDPAVPARIQDPFGLRTLPQVEGAVWDALTRLDDVVAVMAGAPSENPVLLPAAGVAHHGGFQAAYLAEALSAVASGVAQSAQLSLARLAMLCEPTLTGQTPFLSDGSPGASGVMVCEYVAASALGSLRALATPVAVQTVTLSRGAEEGASFASQAARQTLEAVDAYRAVLACELVAAVRALRLRGLAPHGPAARLPDAMADRDLTGDLDQAGAVLAEIATAVAGDQPWPWVAPHPGPTLVTGE
jgi:histidine ammonia-lyase